MLRLVVPGILLLISLLTVIRPPQYHLWLLTIAITEFPWLPVLVATLVIPFVCKSNSSGLLSVALCVIAIGFFLSPVFRIQSVANKLENDLTTAFGKTALQWNMRPFSIAEIFSRHTIWPYTVHTYTDGLQLDYYRAYNHTPRPCVIVVHGGSWAGGDNRQLPELNSVLAAAGYNVAAINYRLAPGCKCPGQVEDVKQALAYLKNNAAHLGIDSNQFILLGRSAGAQITLLASYTLHDPAVVGTISFYGPADMVWGYSLAANPLVFDSRKVMIDYLGGTYEEVPQAYFNSSPIEFTTPQSPPTLMIHGPLDPLVSYYHSVRLNKKLETLHVPHYFLDLPCGTHGCDYTLKGPSGQVCTYAVLGFLDRVSH